MNTYASTLVTFIAQFYYTALLIIILRQNMYNRIRLFFGLYLVSMILWSFSAFMIFADFKLETPLFWNRMLIVGSIAMPVAFYGFTAAFIHKKRTKLLIAGFLAYLLAEVFNLTGQVVISAEVIDGLLFNDYAWAFWYVSAVWAFFIGASTVELVREYRRSKDSIYRNRLRYLLLVIVVIFAGNFTNLSDMKAVPGDVAANTIAAFLITIAILRHHLLDISVVVRKGLVYSILTALTAAAYFLMIQAVFNIFHNLGSAELFLVSLTMAIVAALVMQPLRDRAQFWIDRLFFREKYDASLMLQRISHAAAYVLDLEPLAQMIVNEIAGTLHIGRAVLLIKEQESANYVLIAQYGRGDNDFIGWASYHPLVQLLKNQENLISRLELRALPQYEQFTPQDIADLEMLGGELLIPLEVKDELMGILILGLKLSEETYSEDDRRTLLTLANQTALAIEKARLFSSEQSRREELDALYDLTRQLVATNEVETVIQSTTRHVVTDAHITFARILTPDANLGFFCRAAFPIRTIDHDLGALRIEPPAVLPIYQRALDQTEPIFLSRDDPSLDEEMRSALMLDLANTLCMSPLRVGEQKLGLLILGESREAQREPFDPDKMRLVRAIADQAASALYRANLYEQMEQTFIETVLALANAMDARDTYTSNHSQRLCAMAESICREINSSEADIWNIHWAALLHDIGKIGVPDEILRKTSSLTPQEWEVMRQHPEIGARIVAPVRKLADVAPLIRAHHEWYDGSGYPKGLKGKDIPKGARILSIVDAYGAMTDERTYRKSRINLDAISELRKHAGIQFDPDLVQVFVSILQQQADKTAALANQPVV